MFHKMRKTRTITKLSRKFIKKKKEEIKKIERWTLKIMMISSNFFVAW